MSTSDLDKILSSLHYGRSITARLYSSYLNDHIDTELGLYVFVQFLKGLL